MKKILKENILNSSIGGRELLSHVACSFQKKIFSLESEACLSGNDYEIKTYPVKVENGMVFVSIWL